MTSDDTTPRRTGRSTFRVLGTLALVVVAVLAGLGACVAAYIGSTPARTLEVPRSELAILVPKFYPLPSMGADSSGQTHGVWVTLDDDGTATALSARDPQSGANVQWRPELRVEGTTGVFRDARGGTAYDRGGAALAGPAPRGLDAYEVRVTAQRVVVDLERVRLGACRTAELDNCSPPGAPVYRNGPPPRATPGR